MSQVIHVDRLKKAKSQVLSGESETEDSISESEGAGTSESNLTLDNSPVDKEEDQIGPGRFGRKRMKPVWSKDYVFSISRLSTDMADMNTKVAKRKRTVCPVCTVVSLNFVGIKFRGFSINGCFEGI